MPEVRGQYVGGRALVVGVLSDRRMLMLAGGGRLRTVYVAAFVVGTRDESVGISACMLVTGRRTLSPSNPECPMKPETIAKAKSLLVSVLQGGATYREAGAPYGLGRSTVERTIKALVLQVALERGIPELDEDALSCLPRLRQFREPVLRAVGDYTPGNTRPKRTTLGPEEIATGASRVRQRSENANRDVALIFVLFCTGAKPIEIARLEVRDYLNRDGSVRESSEMRPEAAVNGRGRPLFFTSSRACAAVDAYLVERARRKLGVAGPGAAGDGGYRGLDPSQCAVPDRNRQALRSHGPRAR